MSFISDGAKSKLIEISDDLYPRYKVTFAGKSEHREPEVIEAADWIGKKGITAKGKKCHEREIKKVEFVEPLRKEPEEEEETTPTIINLEPIVEIPDEKDYDETQEPTLF